MAIIAFKLETKGILGMLMTPLIKKGLEKSAIEIAEELKCYVKNGCPHPRKIKSL
jgi:hypothetical protein